MPKYTFQCQTTGCELRFSRTLKMGEWPTLACPTCKEESPRLFEGFGFAFEAGKGASDANTGVHDHDYPTADKIVGRSAETRWAQYRERDKVKKKVREMGGGELLRKDGKGFVEYDSMTETAKKARSKLVDYAVDVESRPIVKAPDQ